MNHATYKVASRKVCRERVMSTAEAARILKEAEGELPTLRLLLKAAAARRRHFGSQVKTCAIINAKSGLCGEDCAFCAQSRSSRAKIDSYPLVSKKVIVDAARRAQEYGAVRYGIVTSGKELRTKRELDIVLAAVEEIASTLSIKPCASLGVLDEKAMRRLRDAGLTRYHHNLEASRAHFARICSTRSYDEQIETVLEAKEAGLSVCSGGIFGIGETIEDRVELLATIRSLDVESVPVNFLVPIQGTRLESAARLTPLECLRLIAVARLMMPERTIRVCGGRESNLRDLQSLIFAAGANAVMIGGYLTTGQRSPEIDMRMIADAVT